MAAQARAAAAGACEVIAHRCMELGCTQLISRQLTYCHAHRPKRDMSARGGGATQRAFRDAVMRQAGYRCEVVLDGVRWSATLGLEAHHVVAIADGGSNHPGNGRAVCLRHHQLLTKVQRLPRAS